MSIFEPSRSVWTPRMLSVLRIVSGLVFLTAGTTKLYGFPPLPAQLPSMPPAPMWEFQLAGYSEVYLGGLFTLGFLTRPIAFILAGEMAVAYFQVSFPLSFWPTRNWGVPAVLHCFIFLYFVFAGGGPWSVDAMIARSRGESRVD
jgi:putative oxidoreductase